MSGNRYYKHYLNTILDVVGTQSSINKFSAAYNLMVQSSFNYNFSLFRSSNGVFVYGASFVLFGSQPHNIISSSSLSSNNRYGSEIATLNNKHWFSNNTGMFFSGIESFSVSVLPNSGAYGFLNFLPLNSNPTHLNVFCNGVSVNPEMASMCWKMRSACTYSLWFNINSGNLLLSWMFLSSFQIPVSSVPFEYFSEEDDVA